MRLTISLTCFLVVGLAGCPGEAPEDTSTPADAAADGPPPIQSQRLSGKVIDYFNPTDTMDAVALASDGIDPALTTTSGTGGLYELLEVPVGSKIYFTATRTSYRATRNAAVSIGDMEVIQDLYVMSSVETARQYTTTGTPETAGTAFVAAEIKRNNGMPFTGLEIDGTTPDISLVDAQNAAVPGVAFFGFSAVDLIPRDPQAVTPQLTADVGGKARIGILNVPPGLHTLKISYLDNNNQPQTITAPVVAIAGGATILVAGGAGGGGGGGGGGGTNPNTITNPVFATDIYPLLQKTSANGLGCASCHSGGGTAGGVLRYDLPAADTLAAIKARPNVIVPTVGAEATSLFLTKPLYEAVINHPNATFLDVNDPYYQLFLRWITQGAL